MQSTARLRPGFFMRGEKAKGDSMTATAACCGHDAESRPAFWRTMTERQKQILRMCLSYVSSNLDELHDAFGLFGDEECPNCHNGTLGLESGRIVCRGECGQDFGEIVHVYSADSYAGNPAIGEGLLGPTYIVQADSLYAGLGLRGKDRPQAHVRRALVAGGTQLLE